MSKRNSITYTKPQDPTFLAKLKAQIGYKEGPTVDTKRQRLDEPTDSGDELSERPEFEDEKPQIVVLKSGDLNAEQVAVEEQRIAKEEAEKPADLNQPIVFKKRQTKKSTEEEEEKTSNKNKNSKHPKEKKSKSKASSSSSSKSKLSFNEDEEDEAAEEY